MKRMVKMILFFIFALPCFHPVIAQTNPIDHWETVVYSDDTWKYFIGNSEPDAHWRELSYNDQEWLQGPGGIGYGDEDDNTEIESCISLFLRIKFNVFDESKIEFAFLNINYDDAFVAYINDVEVARAGISGEHPAFNQPADFGHEAEMPGGGLPAPFSIETDIVKSCLNQGENVLAIQVHNTGTNSSDMSSTTFLTFGVSDTEHLYRKTPDWFQVPLVFDSSDLPIMVIDTEGRNIVDEPKTMARMGIIYNGPGQRNSLSDPFNEYDGWIGIEYRGNASMSFPKKPYTFETRNEDGSNNNVSLLGLPRENDFILRAGFIDKTLMRDALAYFMSRGIGRWAPRTRHVELYLNGSYQGVYILVEKIKPDKNRLNIVRMDSSDIEGEALTGGYVWVVQQSDHDDVVFLNDRREGNARVLKYPSADEVQPEQIEYIRQYEESFRSLMKSSIYNDPVRGYPAYIDVSTFIDEILVQEATANSDAYGWSSFFYKDRNGKMSAGPVWDFDQGLSNSTYNNGHHIDGFVIEKTEDWARPQFWDKLWADKDFKEMVKTKWNEYRKGPFQTERMFAFVDSLTLYLNEAQQRNFQQWPILGVFVWRSTPGVEERDTYQKEVDYMKDWLGARLTWMDQQLYMSSPPDSFEITEGLVAYYKFEESGGTAVMDHSGNGLDGTIMGGATYDEGFVGGGLAFNGVDAYVNCGNPPELNMTEELSLMAWVYPHDITDGGQHDPWISKGDQQYALKNGAGDYFEFFIYDNGWHAPNVELDENYNDEWHHYAGTYDGSELKMYIDGELMQTYEHEGVINTTEYDFYIGSNSQASGRFFEGILDEVRVYDIALSDVEIATIYNSYSDSAVKNHPNLAVSDFILHQNYPNPFNPVTRIAYRLKNTEHVTIKIYNSLGREIKTLINQKQSAGYHYLDFTAPTDLASGIYLYKMQTKKSLEIRKMLLLR
ncbi:CotH kinase family protein [candidate division KSB1 bacterium]|nr:CotH kinase family protein [candidate division KSB1 bacterium]